MIKKASYILPCIILLTAFAACSVKKNRYFRSSVSVHGMGLELDMAELRIKRNDTVWLNFSALGISLARAVATKQGVTVYENLGKTVSRLSWEDISENRHVNYKNLEKLLLGKKQVKLKNFKVAGSRDKGGKIERVVITVDGGSAEIIYRNPQWSDSLKLPFSPPEDYDTVPKKDLLNFL